MPDTPLTMAEAATAHFRCSRRKLQDILRTVEKAYPDVAFYTQTGREKLFFPADIQRIH